MANVLAPFGFEFFGKIEGAAPTVGQIARKIAQGNTNAIGYGDPVIPLGTGYIDIATASTVQIAGIFLGCKYFNTAVGRVVWSKSWPGSGATGDVTAYIDADPNSIFKVQAITGTSAVAFADINANIQLSMATPQTEAAGGFSLSGVDQTNIAATTTFPFRIIGLFSDYVVGQNGTDNTSPNNIIIVRPNYWDRVSMTGI